MAPTKVKPDSAEPTAERPGSRRQLILGALAAAAIIPRKAAAQDVHVFGILRKQQKPPAPKFDIRIVNESVSALPEWTSTNGRLVRRITMGVTSLEMLRVNQSGYQAYLNRQLHPAEIDDSAVEAVVAARWPMLALSNDALFASDANLLRAQMQESTIYRAAFSERQLYERLVEFWSDHFNIQFQKVGYLAAIDNRDVIRANAMGKFRDLLRATAKSTAMLVYLDNTQSRKGAPNQNYVRELMELHTLGVDNGYTQTDVAELARVFTGWTIAGRGNFNFDPNLHDYGQKVVMGRTIPASSSTIGAAAVAEGEQFLDFLAGHPNTATFISTKLLRWLLQADPTATQISVVSRAFKATGGDITLVVRAILNAGWLAAAPAKFKRPFHFLVSALRATAPTVNALNTMNTQLRTLGQPLFEFETPDGYPDKVEYWSGNIMPRWAMGSSLAALNSTVTLKVDTARFLTGTPDAAIDLVSAEFFGGELSTAMRVALLNYLKAGTFNDARVRETLSLAMSSAAFQWY